MDLMDLHSGVTMTSVLGVAARTSTATSSAIDTQQMEGKWAGVLMSKQGTGTAPTLNGKFQSSTASGGTYADISGATFTQVTDAADSMQIIGVDKKAHNRFVKGILTIAGTCPSFTCGLAILSRAKTL